MLSVRALAAALIAAAMLSGAAAAADGKPRAIYITHGEPEAAAAFAGRIGHNLGVPAHVPALGETVTLRS